MRAAAILGPGCSEKTLLPFRMGDGVQILSGMPATAAEADIILIFGGDGTIHRHLGQLVDLGRPVLAVPTGSGNDFARALGLRSLRDSLLLWRRFCAGHAGVRTIDLGVITPLDARAAAISEPPPGHPEAARRYFCSVAGIGLDGEVARRSTALPRWLRGHGGYALTLIPTIFRFAAQPMKILSREEGGWATRGDGRTLLAAFANTSTYGGGMKIAPRALPDDGLLDVCMIGEIGRLKLAGLFPTVYAGRHLSLRGVEYFQARHLRVETAEPTAVYADGEHVCSTPVEFSLQRAALKVLTPSLRC